MGRNYQRHMGFRHNQKWSKIGFHSIPTMVGNKRNKDQFKKCTTFKGRSTESITKECNRKSSKKSNRGRFLQYTLFGSEKNRGSSACYKSQTSKPVFEETSFQDGHIVEGLESSSTRRLGVLSRSKRRLSAHSRMHSAQKISTILHRRPSVSIQNSMFWTDMCTSGVHKDLQCGGSILKNAKCTVSSLFRRLDGSKCITSSVTERSTDNAQSTDRSGFHDKYKEVKSHSHTGHGIHRSTIQVQFEPCVSISRSFDQIERGNYKDQNRSENSQRFSSFAGTDGIVYRFDTECQTIHEANSVTSTLFLETNLSSRNCSALYTSSNESFKMVVTGSKHKQGQIFSELEQLSCSHNRCIQDRFWGTCGEHDVSGNLVDERDQASHQHSGDGGNNSSNETLYAIPVKSECISQVRQCISVPVLEQTGRNQVCNTMLQDVGTLEISYTEQHSVESSTFSRSIEHSSRSVITNQDQTIRMDSKRPSSSQNICSVGNSDDRSVCLGSQSQTSNILFMAISPRSSSSRCSVCFMEQDDCICISSNLFDPEGVGAYETVQMSADSDSTTVATPALVHLPFADGNSSSTETSGASRSIVTTENSDISSKPRTIQSDGLAALDRNFKDSGFSERVRSLLMASWRKGTQSDYASKFKKFNCWCNQRQKDPYTATIVDCAEFLTYLYDSGLKYRTISGYRSMLSAIVHPINNVPVGQHPHLIRLLKGVFVSRPPVSRLVPDWDLMKVLNALQKPPFEPLRKIKLKYLTLKCAFLVAITTFRRCADLQALRLGEGFVCVQNRGITFLRPGLSKQDRPGHTGSKIFVPTFKKNKKLDPKRTLYWYLKRTDDFRDSEDGDVVRLFLSYVEPHQPVSSKTISRWLVETIKSAYGEQKIHVRGHSTRAIGPSWALFNGAPMKAILEAADWSRESTFTKYYLRNVDICALNVD